MAKIRAHEIKKALAQYHSDPYESTIFFEVKNGSTYFNDELLIMDGLAIKHSWKNPCFTGYEIKCSRSDFLNDGKWYGYLDYCHKFYFVCPKGLIRREEIEAMDENVGLIYYSLEYSNCNLYTMKAPVYRNIGIPKKDMLYYIIMSKLESDRYPFLSKKKEFFKEWLQEKKNNIDLSFRIKKSIGEIMREQQFEIDQYHREKKNLERDTKIMKEVFNYLSNKGLLKWSGRELKDDWKERLDEIFKSNLSRRDKSRIENVINALEDLKKII